MTPPDYHLFVGVDIAAQTFTATWASGHMAGNRPILLAQSVEGFTAFRDQLAKTGVAPADTLIVLEATSTYWVALAVALHTAGYHVSVINPAQTANYIKSLPRRSKTDAQDSQMLLQFAQERAPRVWTPPPTIYHELRQHLTARDALAEMRQQARNQRHALQQWPVQVAGVVQQFDAIEADLDARIAELDRRIVSLLRDGAWAESASLLQSIPGIGPSTAAWLLVATLKFELCATPATAVAFVGLAPLQRESGRSVRGRPQLPRSGHGRARKALYLATLRAAQHNPPIKVFYERLRANGKPPKVARCAAARKLLHLAWAVVRTRQRFDPAYQRPAVTRP